jgi:dTDP-4-dehydrorhamnose reductase
VKKYLILGASGLLGSKLIAYTPQSHGTYFKNMTNTGINMSFLDMNNSESFGFLLEKIKPDVVINCTGMTDVDLSERLPEKCWKLNCWLPVTIAQECNAKSIKYVYISSDHFLNLSGAKLKERDVCVPINQYSFSKLNAEKLIYSENKHSLVIRANFFHFNLYSPKTFLDQIIVNIKSGIAVHSFNDVVFSPISINQLIISIMELIKINYSGIVNIGSDYSISKFDFHNMVISALNMNNDLHTAVSIDDLLNLAKRPKNMALDSTKFKSLTGHEIPPICDMIDEEIAIGS